MLKSCTVAAKIKALVHIFSEMGPQAQPHVQSVNNLL